VARCVVEATVRASAPRPVVWDLLSDGRCWTDRGRRVVELSESPFRFGYALSSRLPVRDYHAVVTLTEAGPDATNIHWEARFEGLRPMQALVEATLRDAAAEAERRAGAASAA
jgi:hypothetical protein